MEALLIGIGIILAIIILAVAWIVLPFAVFGLKDLLKEAIEELREIRAIFERIDEARK